MVGPLYLIGELEREMIHAAGGELHFEGPTSARYLTSEHVLQGTHISELAEPLVARRCDFAEFHCMLVRTEAIERVGPFDEALLSAREHEDFCLRVHAHGGEVWFEPDSVVTYLPPARRPQMAQVAGPPLRSSDLPFFALRWSEHWNERSTEHFRRKYGLESRFRKRVRAANEQRQAMLLPVRSPTRRVLGPYLEERLWRVLVRTERRLNARAPISLGVIATGPNGQARAKVEAMGLEPTDLLRATQALYQLSYAPRDRPSYQRPCVARIARIPNTCSAF